MFWYFECGKLSERYHVKKFVLISTDKRQSYQCDGGNETNRRDDCTSSYKYSKTEFVAVRFGNAGKQCSVVPLFKNRSPRDGHNGDSPGSHALFYDDTGSGAAGDSGGGDGERRKIFVLDMGEPKDIDPAENLIRLRDLSRI